MHFTIARPFHLATGFYQTQNQIRSSLEMYGHLGTTIHGQDAHRRDPVYSNCPHLLCCLRILQTLPGVKIQEMCIHASHDLNVAASIVFKIQYATRDHTITLRKRFPYNNKIECSVLRHIYIYLHALHYSFQRSIIYQSLPT